MTEGFTIEYTGNNADAISDWTSNALGEFIYVGILVVDGSTIGALYVHKGWDSTLQYRPGTVTKSAHQSAVHLDWEGRDNGWIGKVIIGNYYELAL